MLVDTDATLTLIKLRNLREDTSVYDEKITLIGAPERKTETFGKIKALKGKYSRQEIHIIKNDFPIKNIRNGLLMETRHALELSHKTVDDWKKYFPTIFTKNVKLVPGVRR